MLVGNVGQLATDLILVSAGPKRVAAVSHPALMAVVGADPLDETSDHLMTVCEGMHHLIYMISSATISNTMRSKIREVDESRYLINSA